MPGFSLAFADERLSRQGELDADGEVPWRRARQNLGLMLAEDLLKEKLDGEALLWANQRLLARPEPRRGLRQHDDRPVAGGPGRDRTLRAQSTAGARPRDQSGNAKMNRLVSTPACNSSDTRLLSSPRANEDPVLTATYCLPPTA